MILNNENCVHSKNSRELWNQIVSRKRKRENETSLIERDATETSGEFGVATSFFFYGRWNIAFSVYNLSRLTAFHVRSAHAHLYWCLYIIFITLHLTKRYVSNYENWNECVSGSVRDKENVYVPSPRIYVHFH